MQISNYVGASEVRKECICINRRSRQVSLPTICFHKHLLFSRRTHVATAPNGALVLSMFLKPNIFLDAELEGQELK